VFAKTTILAVMALLASPALAKSASYGPYPEQTYTTCGSSTGKVAVALMHGGWNDTGYDDRGPVAVLCKYLGQHGIYAVSFDYRLTTTEGQEWPSQWQDAQLVIRWLKKAGYSRVGFVGLSAGGYNALGVAFSPNTIFWETTDPLRETWLYPRYTSTPDFVVAVSPFSDLNDPKLLHPAIRLLTKNIFGSSSNISQQVRNSVASPLIRLHSDIPPLLVFHGLNDKLVPAQESETLSEVMTSIGGKNMRLVLHNGAHLFEGLTLNEKLGLYQQILDCANGVAPSICAPKTQQ
jgi:acetyl esterase/lipase